ncbi:MAG: helix-turn-helix domain-containing protein [Nitrospirota bacterium]
MVGETLRKKREELNLDLRQISDTLKIKYDYLRAIEDGAHERLPADVYVKGYIREYARILNLDPEITLNTYVQESGKPQAAQQAPVPDLHAPRKKFRLVYILLPLIGLLGLVVFFLQSPVQEKPPLPGEVRTQVPEPAEQPVDPPGGSTPAEEALLQSGLPPEKDAFHTLGIHANDTTWLFVMIDQTETRELLMQPGEILQLKAKQGFSLKIGNAGGVKLVFDGKDIGRIGENGAVVNIDLPSSGQ